MHGHLLIIKQDVIVSNLQLRDVMIAAMVEGLNIEKALFSSFNISQILSYHSQLMLLNVCVEFQTLLSTVIKQDVKLSINSIAASQTSVQNSISYN